MKGFFSIKNKGDKNIMRIGDITEDNYMDFMRLFTKEESVKEKPSLNESRTSNHRRARVTQGIPDSPSDLEGLDTTHMSHAERTRLVDVSDDVRNRMIEFVRREFSTQWGMTDGEGCNAIIREYTRGVTPKDRIGTINMLSLIRREEYARLFALAREFNPNWQSGMRIDPRVLDHINPPKGSPFNQRV